MKKYEFRETGELWQVVEIHSETPTAGTKQPLGGSTKGYRKSGN